MKNKIFICLYVIFFSSISQGQMPDWHFFVDRDGNKYYYDLASKIRIADTTNIDLKAVTATGADYYLNYGIELISEGKIPEGLFYLKSLRLLKSDNSRIKKIQIEATRRIDYLYKKHSSRFENFDRDSTIAITFEEDKYNIYNSYLYYQIILKDKPRILSQKWKYNYKGYGLKIGLMNDPDQQDGFDYIIGIESRIFKEITPTVAEAFQSWIFETGMDTLQREEILKDDRRIIFKIKYPDAPFQGFEGVFISKNKSHLVRIFYHSSLEQKLNEDLKDIIKNFKTIQ
jgi:hypothetical protein